MKKKSRRNRCSGALLHSGKCLPHPGIFFKARGKGVTDRGLWLHGVVPSGGESWSYRGPSAENETEETRHEPVKDTRFSAPFMRGFTAAVRSLRACALNQCKVRKAASLPWLVGWMALSVAITSPFWTLHLIACKPQFPQLQKGLVMPTLPWVALYTSLGSAHHDF